MTRAKSCSKICLYDKEVMSVIRAEVIEQLFDIIDETSMIIAAELKLTYLHAMCQSCQNIMAQTVEQTLPQEVMDTLTQQYEQIENLEFSQEEVRKALQLAILKGLKSERLTNEVMTPDSIAMMVSYLISKFMSQSESFKLADLTVGTANLLTAVLNQLETQPQKTYGVELETDLLQVASVLADMQEHEVQFYQQDSTRPLLIEPVEVIIGDLPVYQVEAIANPLHLGKQGCAYAPYLMIENHLNYLVPGGYAFYVIPNDFFNQPHAKTLHAVLQKEAYIQAVLQLPTTMFKQEAQGKSILVLQKQGDAVKPVKEVLLSQLPSFNNPEKLLASLRQIESWLVLNK